MENTAPLEIIASGDIELWIAPLDATKPDVDENPADMGWVKVGKYGNLNYHSDGVGVQHSQTIVKHKAMGDVGTRKVSRTSEELMFKVKVWDLTLATYSLALNHNAITATAAGAGQPGKKKIGLSRGSSVATRSLLLRAPSPEMEDGVMQYYVPRAAQTGNPEVAYSSGEPAGLDLEWEALVDPNAAVPSERFGYLEVQEADATS